MDKDYLDRLIRRYTEVYFYATRRISSVMKEEVLADITTDQYYVLRFIYQNDPCTSSRLAEQFEVNRSAITAMTNRFTDKGYIRRIADPDDRRVIMLSVTEEGKRVVENGEEKIRKFVESYMQELDKDEIEQFIGIYEKVAEAMRNRLGGKET